MVGLEGVRRGCAVGFFDIDGTLLEPVMVTGTLDDSVSGAVERAIRDFVAAGNVAMLSTGRGPDRINKALLPLPFAGYVSLDGSFVRVGDEVVLDQPMEPDAFERLVRECAQVGAKIGFSSSERSMGLAPGACEFRGSPSCSTVAELLATYPDRRVHKGSFFDDGGYERVCALGGVAAELEHYDGGKGSWEFVAPGVSKAAGARAAVEALRGHGLEPSLTFAVGDSPNDISLLEACDVSFAMGNADEAVRALATHVVATVADDGVAEAIRMLEPRWRH